jgi:hypothetical protein
MGELASVATGRLRRPSGPADLGAVKARGPPRRSGRGARVVPQVVTSASARIESPGSLPPSVPPWSTARSRQTLGAAR